MLVSGYREATPRPYENQDYCRFAATAGDQISIHYDTVEGGDPYLLLYDGAEGFLAANNDSFGTVNSFISYIVGTTGNYFVATSSYRGSQLWNYTLTVTGLTPDIMPGPSGVPDVSTWTTIIAGFGAVGAMARRSRQRVPTA